VQRRRGQWSRDGGEGCGTDTHTAQSTRINFSQCALLPRLGRFSHSYCPLARNPTGSAPTTNGKPGPDPNPLHLSIAASIFSRGARTTTTGRQRAPNGALGCTGVDIGCERTCRTRRPDSSQGGC
jgi:hypothetical protein